MSLVTAAKSVAITQMNNKIVIVVARAIKPGGNCPTVTIKIKPVRVGQQPARIVRVARSTGAIFNQPQGLRTTCRHRIIRANCITIT